jgi:hypothetical protein
MLPEITRSRSRVICKAAGGRGVPWSEAPPDPPHPNARSGKKRVVRRRAKAFRLVPPECSFRSVILTSSRCRKGLPTAWSLFSSLGCKPVKEGLFFPRFFFRVPRTSVVTGNGRVSRPDSAGTGEGCPSTPPGIRRGWRRRAPGWRCSCNSFPASSGRRRETGCRPS